MSEKTDKAVLALRTLLSLGIKPTELEMSHETEHELIESMTGIFFDTTATGQGDDLPSKLYPMTLCGIPVKVVY